MKQLVRRLGAKPLINRHFYPVRCDQFAGRAAFPHALATIQNWCIVGFRQFGAAYAHALRRPESKSVCVARHRLVGGAFAHETASPSRAPGAAHDVGRMVRFGDERIGKDRDFFTEGGGFRRVVAFFRCAACAVLIGVCAVDALCSSYRTLSTVLSWRAKRVSARARHPKNLPAQRRAADRLAAADTFAERWTADISRADQSFRRGAGGA